MEGAAKQFLLRALAKMVKSPGINGMVARGVTGIQASPGHCSVEYKVGPEQINPTTDPHTMSTGALYAICDLMSGLPIITAQAPFQSVFSAKINVTYCHPAFLGDELRICGEALHVTPTTGTSRVEVRRVADNALICFGRQVLALRGDARGVEESENL